MDPKQLKKLAKACRDAGITSYTCPEFSFTLSDTLPTKTGKKSTVKDYSASEIQTEDTWESLSDMDKLFYSVNPAALEDTPNEGN